MTLRAIITLPLLAIALAGCATITSEAEITEATRESLPQLPAQWSIDGIPAGDVQIGWIDAIGDPALSALVREAQANNPDIRAAATSVEAARAIVRQARSAQFPQINAAFQIDRSQSPQPFAINDLLYSGNLQASWEVDLWGRVRAGRNAAYASAQAVEADFLFAQYGLASAVASAYFATAEAQEQVNVAQRTVDALAEIDRIVRVRYREGFASRQDTAIAGNDLQTARDSLAQAQLASRATQRALEVLLGRYPDDRLTPETAIPATPPPPPAGVPAQLLERRPDVIAAERRVAVAFANLDQAQAAKLPLVQLTGSGGISSTDLGNILDEGNVIWSIIGSVLQPIFDAGLRDAAADQANAEQRGAVAAYASTALAALRDVEDNLDQVVVLAEREAILTEGAAQARTAFELAELQYAEGEIALIDVLNIQQRLFAAERNLVAIRRARVEQWVALNLALGGAWE